MYTTDLELRSSHQIRAIIIPTNNATPIVLDGIRGKRRQRRWIPGSDTRNESVMRWFRTKRRYCMRKTGMARITYEH